MDSTPLPFFVGSQRFVLAVKDYDICMYFYESIVNFKIVNSWNRSPGDRGTIYRIGDASFELIESGENPANLIGAYLYLNTEIDIPIQNTPWGHRNFSILDPVGMKLKFFSGIESPYIYE